MRRALKAVVCLGLSLSLGFSTVAFGAEKKETEVPKVSIQKMGISSASNLTESGITKSSKGRAAKAVIATPVEAKLCLTPNDLNKAKQYKTAKGSVIGFTVKMPSDGALFVDLKIYNGVTNRLEYSDVLLTDVNDNPIAKGSTSSNTIRVNNLKAGYYNIYIASRIEGNSVYAQVKPYSFINNASKINGSLRAFVGSGRTIYRNFSVKKRSQVWLKAGRESGWSAKVYLQKKSGKKWTRVTDIEYPKLTDASRYFAVSPGSYRIVFESTDANDLYQASFGTKSYTGKYATKKSKSKSISRKKSKTNVLTASDAKKKTHWYKFKVSKRRSTQFKVTTYNSSGSVTATLYKGKKKLSSRTAYSPSYITFKGKLSKGTYYVKVTKNTKNTSGKYIVKYVK